MRRFLTLMLCASWLFASAQVPDYVPTDGFVAWYPLDGDVEDKVGNGRCERGFMLLGCGPHRSGGRFSSVF